MGFLVGFDFIAAAMFFTWVYPPPKKKLNRCQVGKQPINHKLTGDQASHSLHQSWSGKRRFAARAPLRTARSCRNKIRRKNSTFAGGQFQNRRQGILSLKKLFNTHWPKMHLLWCSHSQDQVPHSIAPSGRSSTNEPRCIRQHGIGESCQGPGNSRKTLPCVYVLAKTTKKLEALFFGKEGEIETDTSHIQKSYPS